MIGYDFSYGQRQPVQCGHSCNLASIKVAIDFFFETLKAFWEGK